MPVEHAGAVWEGQHVGREMATAAHERDLHLDATLDITIKEEALLLPV